MAKELPKLFTALAAVPDYAPHAAPLLATPPRASRRVFDDGKVSDHHAIIPTGKAINLDELPRDERRVFDLVARRFLGAFHPDAEFALTDVVIRVGAAEPAAARPRCRPTRRPTGDDDDPLDDAAGASRSFLRAGTRASRRGLAGGRASSSGDRKRADDGGATRAHAAAPRGGPATRRRPSRC